MTLLSGIRVLDLSLQLPGPFCTMMMADYGADVVKIDEPSPRVRNPFAAEDPGTGPLDRYLNRGKRSVTMDLKSAEGKAIFLRLAATADVVVEGFRPGRRPTPRRSTTKRCPRRTRRSSTARSPGTGRTGPMRDVPGHDVNYLSYAGVLGLCGSDRTTADAASGAGGGRLRRVHDGPLRDPDGAAWAGSGRARGRGSTSR